MWITAAQTPLLAFFADFQVATLPVGTHNITVTNENGVTSNALVLTVNQGATTIDLSPSSNPSLFGSLTLTATVTPSDASGTVTFNIDGTNQSTLGTLSGGVATFDASGLATGSHSIYAVYNGRQLRRQHVLGPHAGSPGRDHDLGRLSLDPSNSASR